MGRYPTNKLISRSAILGRYRLQFAGAFEPRIVPDSLAYPVFASVSRGYPDSQGRFTTCYSAVRRDPMLGSLDLHGLVVI